MLNQRRKTREEKGGEGRRREEGKGRKEIQY